MKAKELKLTCEYCDKPTEYADSVPDSAGFGHHTFQYKWIPLCFIHAMERREVATSRLVATLACPIQGIARIDFDRTSGDMLCECGKNYRSHPKDIDHPYLNVLCDGQLVKL